MKAVILAGGRGKRLRPVTDYVPKPLVPINNVPIMEWQIRHLRQFGIRDIILCTGYKTGMIKDRLRAKNYGANITISSEESPLGTGGAIKHAASMIGDDDSFMVINGDVITDMNLSNMTDVRNSVAVIQLRTNFGILEMCDDNITKFSEKSTIPGVWMNAGVYHLGSEVLDDLPTKGDIETTLFPDYVGRGMLKAVQFEDNLVWQSVDSFKDVEKCSELLTGMTTSQNKSYDQVPI